MDKMKLDLNALKVETFEPAEAPEERGTVEGREVLVSRPYASCPDTDCGLSACRTSPCACI